MFLVRTALVAAALVAALAGVSSQSDSRPASAALRAVPSASAPATAPAEKAPEPVVSEETRFAQDFLGDLADKYKHLDGVTVIVGQTPKGEEAVAYYTIGQIVIDTEHTVSTQKILSHEIWHVIDWRDNGKIDWGEDLPPANSADYLSR